MDKQKTGNKSIPHKGKASTKKAECFVCAKCGTPAPTPFDVCSKCGDDEVKRIRQ